MSVQTEYSGYVVNFEVRGRCKSRMFGIFWWAHDGWTEVVEMQTRRNRGEVCHVIATCR